MTQHDENTEKDDRLERYQRRHIQAKKNIQENIPRQHRTPYKRKQVDYDDYLLEDEWFEYNN